MRQQYKQEWRQELIKGMQELSQEGFRCFILKENPSFLFGFVVTPNDNVLYIQRDSFEFRGWTASLKYVPSKENGNGCMCFEEPFQEITIDIIEQAEEDGLALARRLGAQLFKNSGEFFKNLWNASEYEEIKKGE